jgi:hypothetical protein
LTKIRALSDLLKDEQPNFLGREAGVVDNLGGADPILLGTVLQQDGSGGLEPWDMSATTPDPGEIYGILLDNVQPGVKTGVAVLTAGPAAVDPAFLIWTSAAQPKIGAGLGALKNRKFIFTREPIATGVYPRQINPETINP